MNCLKHIVVGAPELPTETQETMIANFASKNGINLGKTIVGGVNHPSYNIREIRRSTELNTEWHYPIVTAYFPVAAELMASGIPVFYCGYSIARAVDDRRHIALVVENGTTFIKFYPAGNPTQYACLESVSFYETTAIATEAWEREQKADDLTGVEATQEAEVIDTPQTEPTKTPAKAMTRRESIARRAAQMRDDGVDITEIARKLLGSSIGAGNNSGRASFIRSLLREYDGGAFDGKEYMTCTSHQLGSTFLEKHAPYHAQVKAYFDDCLMSTEVAKRMDDHGVKLCDQMVTKIYHASRNGYFDVAPPTIESTDLPKQAELIGDAKDTKYPYFAENGDLVFSRHSRYTVDTARRHAKIAEECAKLRKKGRTHNEIVAVIAKKFGYEMSTTTAGVMLAAHKAGMFNRI